MRLYCEHIGGSFPSVNMHWRTQDDDDGDDGNDDGNGDDHDHDHDASAPAQRPNGPLQICCFYSKLNKF